MIKLTDKLFLTADKDNYIVGEQPRSDRKGQVHDAHYFGKLSPTIQYAIDRTLRENIETGAIQTLIQFTAKHEKLNQQFTDQMQAVNFR